MGQRDHVSVVTATGVRVWCQQQGWEGGLEGRCAWVPGAGETRMKDTKCQPPKSDQGLEVHGSMVQHLERVQMCKQVCEH